MTWTGQTAKPNARSFGHALVLGTSIYHLGGNPRQLVPGSPDVYMDNLTHESFDTATNTWTTRASVPADAWSHYFPPSGFFGNNYMGLVNKATVANGCIHVIAGDRGLFDTGANKHYRYIPGSNTWEWRTPFPQANGLQPIIWQGLGTDIISLRSSTYWSTEGTDRGACYKYNATTDVWTHFASVSDTIFSGSVVKHDNANQFWYGDNRGDSSYSAVVYAHYFDKSNNSFNQTNSPMIIRSAKWISSRSMYYTFQTYYDQYNGSAPSAWDANLSPIALGGRKAGGPGILNGVSEAVVGGNLYLFGGSAGDPAAYYTQNYRWNPDMPVPTSVTPVQGATVNTDIPTLGATVSSTGTYAILQWQLARDAGFGTNLRNFSEEEGWSTYGTQGPYKLSGAGTIDIPAGFNIELFQGLWYLRARQKNGVEEYSPWTTSQTFTVDHKPSAAPVTPSGDSTLDYQTAGSVTFEWTFSDASPVDFQTAWQIVCERNDNGTVIFDTGKIASQNTRSYTYNFAASAKDLQLRWKVRVWDSDDITVGYSNYALFRVSDKPTVNITAPAEGSMTSSSAPTVSWTFTATGGRTQASYRVRFMQNGGTIHDTGVMSGAATSYTPSASVLGSGGIVVQVDVSDNVGLTGSDTNNFSVNFTPPDKPSDFTLDASQYESGGFIRVQWNNATKDSAFMAWRIRRRIAGSGAVPSIVYETAVDQSTYTYDDYSAGSNIQYEYFIVQVAARGGVGAESTYTNGKLVTGTSTKYWLVHQTDNSKNILLHHVSDEAFADEYETNTMTLIGRGRKVDIGTYLGYSGTLTAKLQDKAGGMTARQQRMQLEDLKRRKESIFLRTPFGDVFLVNLGNLSFKRIAGTGMHEMLEVSIPYEEVR
jgi:hypothetical protein